MNTWYRTHCAIYKINKIRQYNMKTDLWCLRYLIKKALLIYNQTFDCLIVD